MLISDSQTVQYMALPALEYITICFVADVVGLLKQYDRSRSLVTSPPKGPIARMWNSLLFCYDSQFGPDHKLSRHEISPNDSLDPFDQAQAMRRIYLYVLLLHTTMVLSPTTYLDFSSGVAAAMEWFTS